MLRRPTAHVEITTAEVVSATLRPSDGIASPVQRDAGRMHQQSPPETAPGWCSAGAKKPPRIWIGDPA